MTNEQAEKEWQDLVKFESTKLFISESSNVYGFEQGIDFVRSNLSQLPEVSELISAAKELARDCGCISPYRIDVQEALKNLESKE